MRNQTVGKEWAESLPRWTKVRMRTLGFVLWLDSTKFVEKRILHLWWVLDGLLNGSHWCWSLSHWQKIQNRERNYHRPDVLATTQQPQVVSSSDASQAEEHVTQALSDLAFHKKQYELFNLKHLFWVFGLDSLQWMRLAAKELTFKVLSYKIVMKCLWVCD